MIMRAPLIRLPRTILAPRRGVSVHRPTVSTTRHRAACPRESLRPGPIPTPGRDHALDFCPGAKTRGRARNGALTLLPRGKNPGPETETAPSPFCPGAKARGRDRNSPLPVLPRGKNQASRPKQPPSRFAPGQKPGAETETAPSPFCPGAKAGIETETAPFPVASWNRWDIRKDMRKDIRKAQCSTQCSGRHRDRHIGGGS